MQVLDPSQDRLLAARHRGLIPESVGDFRNPTREFLFDRLCPGNADPRRDQGSGHRIMKQNLGDLCLAIAQENNEVVMVAGKGVGAARPHLEFRPSGLLDEEPFSRRG